MTADLRFALRQYLRRPGFTAVVVLTLAIGIGLNTAMFSIVNATFLRDLPYPSPDRLAYITETNRRGDMPVSYPDFLDWQRQQQSFSTLAFCAYDSATVMTPSGGERVSAALITADYFDTLGAGFARGRPLQPADDLPESAPVVWLAHSAWMRLFDGDPSVVGRTLQVDGAPATVAGILSPSFRYLRNIEVYRPLAPITASRFFTMRENHSSSHVVARLRDSVSLGTANAELSAIASRIARDYPKSNTGVSATGTSLRERVSGPARLQFWLLLGSAGAVLLIACVNVANMYLARSLSRQKELALRIAIGASRARIVRQLLVESMVLSFMGGLAGLLLGAWASSFGNLLMPAEVRALSTSTIALDWRVFSFAALAVLATGLVSGLLPALRLSRTDPNNALKSTPATVHTAFGRFRVGDLLVATQVALALMLLIGSGLLIRSLYRLSQVNPGFEPGRVISIRLGAPSGAKTRGAPFAAVQHYTRIAEAVRQLPEVESAAVATAVPFTGNNSNMIFYRADMPVPQNGSMPFAESHYVTEDYFRTMGIPVLRGRVFNGSERVPEIPAGVDLSPKNIPLYYDGFVLSCVISRRMAEQYWPGEDALGKRFRLGLPDMNLPLAEVVGIVGNTIQQGLDRSEAAEFYLLQQQLPLPWGVRILCVRTRTSVNSAIPQVLAAARNVSNGEPVYDARVLSDRIDGTKDARRFNMGLYSSFATIALLLSAVGIYGVLAFSVSRRIREVGIRMALGARRFDILRLILGQVLAFFLPGAVAGLLAAWAGARLLQSQLFGITPADAPTFACALILLLLVAAAASWLPARRAISVNPTEALRTE